MCVVHLICYDIYSCQNERSESRHNQILYSVGNDASDMKMIIRFQSLKI